MTTPCLIVIDTAGAVDALARDVRDPKRTTPIVCLTSRAGEVRPAIAAERVRKELEGQFIFVFVPTGPRTKQLTGLLPDRFGVYGGSARIWWPGVTGSSLARDHPLIFDRTFRYGVAAVENLRQAWLRGGPPTPAPRTATPADVECAEAHARERSEAR
jgi:hypothetical protein